MNTLHSPAQTDARPRAWQAHDLLWVAGTDALRSRVPLPSWASAEWLAVAPVVVRREAIVDHAVIPVGLRYQARNQRASAYLTSDAVARHVTPEMLSRRSAWEQATQLASLPAWQALAAVAPLLDATGLAWGPTGSLGFSLASGVNVSNMQSDLDLVVRAPRPLTEELIAALLVLRTSLPCRVDTQIETGQGAFALAEWEHGRHSVLLKTDHGPLLTDDPWNIDTRRAAGVALAS